jgi:hypothetical protein
VITPKTRKHWDRITSTGECICFVCDRKFKKDQTKIFIGLHKYNGEKLYRHTHCDALTQNWFKKFKARRKIKPRVKLKIKIRRRDK